MGETALQVAKLALELTIRIYDDTPKERRVAEIERWYKILDEIRDFLRTGKLPELKIAA